MEKIRIPMKRMMVGGWYEDKSKKVSKGPFLVVYSDRHLLVISSTDPDREREIVTRRSLYGKLVLAEVPTFSEIVQLCDRFNETSHAARTTAIAVHPAFLCRFDLVALGPAQNHPCGVSVLNLHYDPQTKTVVSRPNTTISTATVLAKAEWQKKYPDCWIVVCEPTDHNTMTFKCPRCGLIHEHGLLDGPRVSHCSGIDSDYIVIARK